MDKLPIVDEKVESVDESDDEVWEPPTRTLHKCRGHLAFDLARIQALTEEIIEASLGEYCEWVMWNGKHKYKRHVESDVERWDLLKEGWQVVGFICPECRDEVSTECVVADNYPLLGCCKCGRYIDASCMGVRIIV